MPATCGTDTKQTDPNGHVIFLSRNLRHVLNLRRKMGKNIRSIPITCTSLKTRDTPRTAEERVCRWNRRNQAQLAMHKVRLNAVCPGWHLWTLETIPQDSDQSCEFSSWPPGIHSSGEILLSVFSTWSGRSLCIYCRPWECGQPWRLEVCSLGFWNLMK